jgi:hypothetical protein
MLFKGELVVMLTESRIYGMYLQKGVNNGFKKKYWCIYLLSYPGRQPTTVRKKVQRAEYEVRTEGGK